MKKFNFLTKTRWLVTIIVLTILSVGNAWGETITLTQSALGLTGSYTTNTTKTVSNVDFTYTDLMKNSDNIQVKASSGVIYNSTLVPGKITRVDITHSGTARSTTIAMGTSTSDYSAGSYSNSGSIYLNGPANTCCGYFKITRGSNAAYWTQVEITYTAATITLSKNSISGLNYNVGSGPSAAQTFTVSGSNIPANLTVTAPTNFEVSLDGSSWASSKTINVTLTGSASAGTLSATTVYVRLASGKSAGNYSGNVSIAMAGCNTISSVNPKTVAVSGTVSAAAVTSVSASPSNIAFPDNTVEVGTDEATSTITLSNGYASYGNYLFGWFEDLSDEDHCEFFVNEDYTYSYTSSGSATPTLTFSYLADAAGTFTGKFIIQGYNSSYTAVNCTIPLSVTLTSSCSSAVSIATGTPTNCTISASAASVSTCSGTRQVTISVTPNSCYAAPVKASVTSTGTTATWVSGPTLNSGHYDYVYSFAENATGTTTFNASLSTKTTYTVSYAAGSVPSGGGSITGSHVNDSKTCGTSMALPGETFHTTGYTQTGWSKTNGGSQYAAVGGTYTDNVAQTFYPVWTANKYTVTWSVNNNTSTISATTNVPYNTTVPMPTPSIPVDCTGSTFMGWTTSANASYSGDSAPSPLYNTTSPAITGDVTFYAVFATED